MNIKSGVGALVGILAAICGCSSHGDAVIGEVIESNSSPTGDIVAVISRDSGGATTAFVERVYLRIPASGMAQEILRADRASELKTSWQSADELLIHLSCGRVFAFKNFYSIIGVNGELLRTVGIRLEAGGLCRSQP